MSAVGGADSQLNPLPTRTRRVTSPGTTLAVKIPLPSDKLENESQPSSESFILKRRRFRMDDIAANLAHLKLALSAARAKLPGAGNDGNRADSPRKSDKPGDPPETSPGKQKEARGQEAKERKPPHSGKKAKGGGSQDAAKTPVKQGGPPPKTDSKTSDHADVKEAVGKDAPSGAPEKSKAELRKERRAIQEAQRAAKEQAKTAKGGPAVVQKAQNQKPVGQQQKPTKGEAASKPTSETKRTASPTKKVAGATNEAKTADGTAASKKPSGQQKLSGRGKDAAKRRGMAGPFVFPHLADSITEDDIFGDLPVVNGPYHPAIVKLGLQMCRGIVRGSTSRALALLYALHDVVTDYEAPSGKEIRRDFDSAVLAPSLEFLDRCRPLSLSMRNVVEVLRQAMSNMDPCIDDAAVQKLLKEHLTEAAGFILKAREEIGELARQKVVPGDVILIYGFYSLVTSVLKLAWQTNKSFKVLVVDSQPDLEGRLALEELASAGVPCGYCEIDALRPAMSNATKVFLGAEAIMTNGAVMGRIGSSQVAQTAGLFNVPVLVCCETFKFSETVQTDSFHFNELGPESELFNSSPVESFRKRAADPGAGDDGSKLGSIRALNLRYDVMPGDFVSALITETGMLPCSSVPVVNRENFLRRS